MLGRRRPIDGTLIDPAVVKFTGERFHQKADVDKQNRLARAERSARFTRSDRGSDDDGDSRPTRAATHASAASKKAAAGAAALGAKVGV